ncbi:MAG: molybdenum cofactor biosynthesis protein MoaE [Acidobacteriota bacterium]
MTITREPLSIERLAADVERRGRDVGEGCGAVCSFLGVVRATHQHRRVTALDYEAFEPLAARAFEQISSEIAGQWPRVLIAIHHRTGRLEVGEASVAIVAGGAHRAETFAACRYAIERVKQIAPIWKHEYFEDGDAWVEGAVVDPADDAARREALARACA